MVMSCFLLPSVLLLYLYWLHCASCVLCLCVFLLQTKHPCAEHAPVVSTGQDSKCKPAWSAMHLSFSRVSYSLLLGVVWSAAHFCWILLFFENCLDHQCQLPSFLWAKLFIQIFAPESMIYFEVLETKQKTRSNIVPAVRCQVHFLAWEQAIDSCISSNPSMLSVPRRAVIGFYFWVANISGCMQSTFARTGSAKIFFSLPDDVLRK